MPSGWVVTGRPTVCSGCSRVFTPDQVAPNRRKQLTRVCPSCRKQEKDQKKKRKGQRE